MVKKKKEKQILDKEDKAKHDNKKNIKKTKHRKKEDKKEKKKISKKTKIILTIAIILIILLIVSYMLSLRIRFILKEEMSLEMVPMQKSFDVYREDDVSINFTISLSNPRLCKSYCEFKLIDVSQGKTIYENSSHDQKEMFFSYNLDLPERGSGQVIFNYKVACNNIKSRLCATNEKKYYKTALITVNYKLNETESQIKEKLFNNISFYLNNIENSHLLLNKNFELLNLINDNTIEYKENFNKNIELNNLLNQSKHEEYLSLWKKEDYFKLNELFNYDFSIELLNEINQTNYNLKNIINNYNNNILILNNILNETNHNKIYSFYYYLNNSKLNDVIIFRNNFNNIINSINDNFQSYNELNNKIKNLNEDNKLIIDQFEIDYKNQSDLLYENLDRIINILNESNISNNISNEICLDINSIREKTINYNKQKEINFNNTYPFIDRTEIEDALYNYFLYNVNLSHEFNYNDYTNLSFLYETNFTSINQTHYNLSEIDLDLITPIYFDDLIKEYETLFCSETLNLGLIKNVPNKINQTISVNQKLFLEIKENKETCCFKGKCEDCCNDDCDNLIPIVFLHGHAITQDNRPEMSHEAFAKIQELLEDEGYINAGHLGEGQIGEIPKGDWGKVRAPFSIRLSYYLIKSYDIGSYSLITQKTDNIENYALRLNDLINVVKERTGKDKVNIVAHSMGGLVVRDYMYIFGTDNVNKVILVGTPNHGIEGRVQRLCSITGASRECNDMAAGSTFMRKINRPSNVPDVDLYTIRAIGCDMNGIDGDGIVLADNVPLDFATNFVIEGECTDFLNSNLHTRFLDPDFYPQTFELIKQIIFED